MSRTEYMREILDACADPFVERITFMKSSQVGGTETVQSFVGYSIDEDPGPLLYVMPTEKDATGLAGRRLRSLINDTEAVARHRTDRLNDLRGDFWELDRMPMRLAWPTASKLASMAAKIVILDEVDKFEKFTGKEANPVRLAEKRTDTYRANRKIILISTPVLEDGHINQQFLKSSQERYWVPCPHCGEFQRLVWSQMKWPKDERDGEKIKIRRLAWYECIHCHEPIRDRHKPAMLRKGRWCPEGCVVTREGRLEGQVPETTHRGFHINALYSPWMDFSSLVAEWLEVQGVPTDLQDFINSRLGEPWSLKVKAKSKSEIEHLEMPYQPGVVPAEAALLTCTVDVQGDRCYYVFRAWRDGFTSWLIKWGEVARLLAPQPGEPAEEFNPWRELERDVITAEFPWVGSQTPMRPRMVLIDSGSFTHEVYAFALRHPQLVRPIKGNPYSMRGAPYRPTFIERDRRGALLQQGVTMWWVDANYYRDKVTGLMERAPGTPGRWNVYAGVEDTYKEQLTSEHKVLERNRQTGAGRLVWKLKPGHHANHLWDCEVYQVAAADMCGVDRLTPAMATAVRRAAQPQAAPMERDVQQAQGWWQGGSEYWDR